MAPVASALLHVATCSATARRQPQPTRACFHREQNCLDLDVSDFFMTRAHRNTKVRASKLLNKLQKSVGGRGRRAARFGSLATRTCSYFCIHCDTHTRSNYAHVPRPSSQLRLPRWRLASYRGPGKFKSSKNTQKKVKWPRVRRKFLDKTQPTRVFNGAKTE